MKSPITPTIFRAYDIRGIVARDLNETAARLIGQALATQGKEAGVTCIAVGRDGRNSSPQLAAALCAGIHTAGVNTLDIGMVPTPVTYWAAHHAAGGSCAMITGSHNPKDYNGIKMMLAGTTLAGAQIQQLRELIDADNLADVGTVAAARGSGQTDLSILAAYGDALVAGRHLKRPVKVVVDCGNGVTGVCAPDLLTRLGAEVIPLFTEVDGEFPNHHPDPADPANFAAASAALTEHNAELALAFDGDGDRLGIWLPTSGMMFPDRMLMLLARELLAQPQHAQATVIYDVKCSNNLATFIRAHGGTPLMVRTGHSFVKRALAETGAPLAGELSGHFFFNEGDWKFDDGLLAAVKLLELVAASPSAEELCATVPDSWATPEYQVDLDATVDAPAVIATLATLDNFPGALELSTIDGVRAQWADGFGLVRASNTTPSLILRFEGHDAQACARIMDCYRACLRHALPETDLGF